MFWNKKNPETSVLSEDVDKNALIDIIFHVFGMFLLLLLLSSTNLDAFEVCLVPVVWPGLR